MRSASVFAIPLLICAAICAASSSAYAADGRDDANKSKFVSRIYQLTLGPKERCSYPGVDSSFNSELGRFQKQYSNLLKLVVESPHYSLAKQQFALHATFDPAKDTIEGVKTECEYLASLMRSMIDTADGQRTEREIENTLSN